MTALHLAESVEASRSPGLALRLIADRQYAPRLRERIRAYDIARLLNWPPAEVQRLREEMEAEALDLLELQATADQVEQMESIRDAAVAPQRSRREGALPRRDLRLEHAFRQIAAGEGGA